VKAKTIRIALGIAAVLAAAIAVTALAQAATIGSVTVAIGPVQVFRDGEARGIPAKPALDVRLGDRIETGAGGRVKVFLTRDNSVLQIGERSSLVIDVLEYAEATRTHRAVFRLLVGKVRVIINRVFGVQTDAKIESPTAVAGVTGTTLIVGYDMGTKVSAVLTVDGTVRVTGVGAKKAFTRDVTKGRIAFVARGDAPTAPRAVTQKELEEWLADTEVPGPPPTDLTRLDKRSLTDRPIAMSVRDAPGGGSSEPKDQARRKEAEEIGLEPIESTPDDDISDDDATDDDISDDDDATDDDVTDDDQDADVSIDVQFPESKGGGADEDTKKRRK
jgi:hypothetical protein